MKKLTLSLLFASTVLVTTAASAAPPPNVLGNWSVLGNQTAGALVINFQAAVGICRRITGAIYGNPIEGFYCPATGRIHFLRKNAANNDTFQSWTGNVGDDAAIDRMGGTFMASTPAGGVPGEYNFQAAK
ncbi:MAG: hypothetical protein HY308_17170 [Gammaproteobacteria bacterium]|nr:hypothetical protein [Gammaproteobacteria bacterium]